jgi:Ca2+-binding EF-hand superfamily protein
VNKIDKNHDGSITQNELRNWIRYQHKYFNQKHTDKIWAKVNSNNDDQLTFDELIDNTIGGTETCWLFKKF